MRIIVFLLTTIVVSFAAAAATSPLEPTLGLSPTQISINGATAGGKVVLFGTSLQTERGMQTSRRFQEILTDADRDGVLSYEPIGGVPLRSIWTIVDLESGVKVTRVPEGYDLVEREIDSKELKKASDGSLDSLVLEKRAVDLVLVRASTGAWALHGREGVVDDDHVRDGKLTLLFESGTPLSEDFGKAPKHLKAGDILIAIDAGRMELMTWVVTK
jgi:hypothetical protein